MKNYIFISIILISLSTSKVWSSQCSAYLGHIQQESVLALLGITHDPILNPITITGSLIGSPPARQSIQDDNQSHFGEFAKYRPLFATTMSQILQQHFLAKKFTALNPSEQKMAVAYFIEQLINNFNFDQLGRSFFERYIDVWVMSSGIYDDQPNIMEQFMTHRKILRNSETVQVLFTDYLTQYFMRPDNYWSISSDFIDALFSMSRELEDLKDLRFADYFEQLPSLNPVGRGSNKILRRFFRTSGAVIFRYEAFADKAFKLREKILNLRNNVNLNSVDSLDARSAISDEFSELLLEAQFILSERNILHENIIDVFRRRLEKVKVPWYFPTAGQQEKSKTAMENINQQFLSFMDLFEDYEDVTSLSVIQMLTGINLLMNQLDTTDFSPSDEYIMYSKTIVDKLDAIALQRNLVLKQLNQLRGNLIQ